MESMFSSLLELASRSGAPIAINGNIESGAHIRALSYSCLLALAVAGESTGHLMRSTAALLMSPISYAGELIFMPGVYVYKHKNDFFQYQPGWLGIAGRTLYYKSNETQRLNWLW